MLPYLTVVVAGHQGTQTELEGIQRFADAWIDQARRYQLASELIIAGPQLAPVLNAPQNTGFCEVRFVEVAAGSTASKAKNAGIRQARGEFVLVTNPRVLFSDELVQFLAVRRLEQGRMYRIDRYDVDAQLPSSAGVADKLRFCCENSVLLHALEGTFAITKDGLRRNMPDDINQVDSDLHFGAGWFPPEKYPVSGETFRWMYNDAEVFAAVPEGGGILLLEMEPGPGLARLPQMLQVIDESGVPVTEWTIAGRTAVAVVVPAAGPMNRRRIRLRVHDGGRPVLDDDRILNLAVFRCDWVAPNPSRQNESSLSSSIQAHKLTLRRLLGARVEADGVFSAMARGPLIALRAAQLLNRRGPDIFEAGMDFQLGPGWFYLEESGAERFRWLSTAARLFLRLPQSTSRLALLIEPASSGGDEPLTFVARAHDENGAVLARLPISGLSYFEFTIPAAPGSVAALHFSCEGPVRPSGEDARPLSFRFFACGAGFYQSAKPAPLKNWPVLLLDSKPVTKDWIAALEPVQRELNEMGHPDHLNTNAASSFLLMSRAHWLDVRGYPEVGMTPEHLDTLLCCAINHCGIREEVLTEPLRIYGIADDSPSDRAQHESNHFSMPVEVQHEDLMWLIAQMRYLHSPVIFNRDDWGS